MFVSHGTPKPRSSRTKFNERILNVTKTVLKLLTGVITLARGRFTSQGDMVIMTTRIVGLTAVVLLVTTAAIGMTVIPEGSFEREDGRTVEVKSFAIAPHELTKKEYDAVRAWGA